jgi:hypothetical protein
MKKPIKSAVKSAKAKTKKAPAKSKMATPGRKSAKITKDVRQAAARKPAPLARAKKMAGADIDHLGDLPRSYGEERIFVVAQEPHWLFCYWDYTLTEGVEGTIFLRHGREGADRPEAEVPVPSETNSWYLAVRETDADYYVELGHYNGGHWKALARSGTVLTPRDTMTGFGEPVFANMPFHATFQQLVEKIRGTMREGESLADALARLQGHGALPISRLTPAQRIALDRLLGTEIGSLTSGELSSSLGSPGASLFSGGFAPSSWASAPGGSPGGFLAALGISGASWQSAPGSWSSAALSGRGASSSWSSSWHGGREFFMHLNAEVIFYGGTHPDAKVTVDGKEIMIRPDGTFRYHFVLPDGAFEIPVVATSPDGAETRRGVLRFERSTTREGDVASTMQPPLSVPMGRKRS